MMMRALTVRQPWAAQIVDGDKIIENRTWHPPSTMRILIHAGVRPAAGVPMQPRDLADTGSILGSVMVADWHDGDCCDGTCTYAAGAMSRHHFGAAPDRRFWHWELRSPRRFVTPIPRVRGALGLWMPPDTLQHLIETAEVVR